MVFSILGVKGGKSVGIGRGVGDKVGVIKVGEMVGVTSPVDSVSS